jgi:hypothetical protein
MRVMDWIILVVGTAMGIVALTADLIGAGAYPGFGWKQGTATAVAVVLVATAAVRIMRRDRRPPS